MKHTLDFFQNCLSIQRVDRGVYEVRLHVDDYYRYGISYDTYAYDRIKMSDRYTSNYVQYGYTELQAYESLYSCLTPYKAYYR